MEASRLRLARGAQVSPGHPAVEARLRTLLRRRGAVTFAEFMAVALYDPVGGYYTRVGPGRDYRTSPQTSPAFGHMIGRLTAAMWRGLGSPRRFDLVELGAADLALASQVTAFLRAREPACARATRYVAVDRAAAPPETPAGVDRLVADAAALPLRGLTGCVLSNELFDALPVHRLIGREDGLGELWVVERDGRFAWEVGAPSGPFGLVPPPGHVVEVAPGAPAIVGEVAARLERGYLLTIDYGGPRDELTAPFRRDGTLLAYHRQRAHERVLDRPGEQDLTAHVDFTTLVEAGEAAGLRTALLTTQRELLRRLGLADWLARLDPDRLGPADLFNARAGAAALVAPGGLGKLRVLLQTRDAPDPV